MYFLRQKGNTEMEASFPFGVTHTFTAVQGIHSFTKSHPTHRAQMTWEMLVAVKPLSPTFYWSPLLKSAKAVA